MAKRVGHCWSKGKTYLLPLLEELTHSEEKELNPREFQESVPTFIEALLFCFQSIALVPGDAGSNAAFSFHQSLSRLAPRPSLSSRG